MPRHTGFPDSKKKVSCTAGFASDIATCRIPIPQSTSYVPLCRDEEVPSSSFPLPFSVKFKRKNTDIYSAYILGANSPDHPDATKLSVELCKSQDSCAETDFSIKLPSELAKPSLSTTNRHPKNGIFELAGGGQDFFSYLLFASGICSSSGSTREKLHKIVSERYNCGLLAPYDYHSAFKFLKEKSATIDFSEHAISTISSLIDEDISMSQTRWAQLSSIMDFVNVEVSLYRMLLEYDRYFREISIPTALWRRSGQILKTNSSFLTLVGVDRDKSPHSILDFFCEKTFLNYLKRYIGIAYDLEHRTVLTCAFLKRPDQKNGPFVSCSFSFTVRRDIHGVPCLIVGQFIAT
ncbi:Transcription factor [Mitosporidium daphniae]